MKKARSEKTQTSFYFFHFFEKPEKNVDRRKIYFPLFVGVEQKNPSSFMFLFFHHLMRKKKKRKKERKKEVLHSRLIFSNLYVVILVSYSMVDVSHKKCLFLNVSKMFIFCFRVV